MVGACAVSGRSQLLIWSITRGLGCLLAVDVAYRRLEEVGARSAVIGDVGQCGDLGPLFIGWKSSTKVKKFSQIPELN
jgi:hypothetical protein